MGCHARNPLLPPLAPSLPPTPPPPPAFGPTLSDELAFDSTRLLSSNKHI